MTRSFAKEGEIPFSVTELDKPCHIWYKIIGDMKSNAIPLVTLQEDLGPATSTSSTSQILPTYMASRLCSTTKSVMGNPLD